MKLLKSQEGYTLGELIKAIFLVLLLSFIILVCILIIIKLTERETDKPRISFQTTVGQTQTSK